MKNVKILVLDDEESLCEILQFNLEIEGFDVDVAYSSEQALTMNLSEYHLILLDVMMGEMSGFKFARLLKSNEATASTPIIFCTAKDTEDDVIRGLNIGADDYIVKPYSVREVIARTKSVLRRSMSVGKKATEDNSVIHFEKMVVDLLKMKCFIDGVEVSLTKKELGILVLLLENRGRVLQRDEILRKIWNDEVVVLDRTIDVNITRLRKKIAPYGQLIKTRSGYGYGFEI